MANNALFCTNNGLDEINFSGQSISEGTYITVSDFSQPTPIENIFQCVQVIGADEPGASLSATTETYTSCYECLANNYTRIGLSSCDGNDPNPNIMISASCDKTMNLIFPNDKNEHEIKKKYIEKML